jgi:hypothetical protein
VEIQHTDGASLDQATREGGFSHDHHGIEGRSILRQRVGDEAVVEGITDRGVHHPVKNHHTSLGQVFILISASRRYLHDEIYQSWRRRRGELMEIHSEQKRLGSIAEKGTFDQ